MNLEMKARVSLFRLLLLIAGTAVFLITLNSLSGKYAKQVRRIKQTNIFQPLDKTSLSSYPQKELLKGEIVTGNFQAVSNFLGIVSVRFQTFSRINSESLTFRLKQKEDVNWYYSKIYKTDQFQNNQFFTFGFPIISDSAGKEYLFEIESENGRTGDGVTVSTEEPVLELQYKYDRSELFNDLRVLLPFIINKIKYSFVLGDILLSLPVLLLSLTVICLNLKQLKLILQNLKNSYHSGGNNRALEKMLMILLLIIGSRFLVSYGGNAYVVTAPEEIYKSYNKVPLGTDLYLGVYYPTLKMLSGEIYYDGISSYGPAFGLAVSPLIVQCAKNIPGNINGIPLCAVYLYRLVIFISFTGFIALIYFITKSIGSEPRAILLIFYIAFLSGQAGSFTMNQGNIDNILALILACAMALVTGVCSLKGKRKILYSLIIGALSGLLAGTKIFLLPLTLPLILFSPSAVISLSVAIMTFIFFSISPAFFGLGNIWDSFFTPLAMWSKGASGYFDDYRFITFNHSFEAVSTLITTCVGSHSCLKDGRFLLIIKLTALILSFLVYCYPVISLLREKGNGLREFINILKRHIGENRYHLSGFFLLLSYGSAFINLSPNSVYLYRLYYSLPVVMIFFVSSLQNRRVRNLIVKSMVFLLLKGLWLFISVDPNGFNLFDARMMSAFVLLHYYYLIKASWVWLFAVSDRDKKKETKGKI